MRTSLNLSVASGEFGIVYRGQIIKLVGGKTSVEIVAVKTLKGIGIIWCSDVHHEEETACPNAGFYDSNAVKEMLRECSKMYKFDHPNVLSLIGVCLDGGTAPYIIVPFMTNGSLLAYLKSNRKRLVISRGEDDEEEVST